MPNDQPNTTDRATTWAEGNTFAAGNFAVEDTADGAWFRFEDLGTGNFFEMSQIEAREFRAWLGSRLFP